MIPLFLYFLFLMSLAVIWTGNESTDVQRKRAKLFGKRFYDVETKI